MIGKFLRLHVSIRFVWRQQRSKRFHYVLFIASLYNVLRSWEDRCIVRLFWK